MNVVITGASRGIGLELTRIALANKYRVLAAARSPMKSKELVALKEKYPQALDLVTADLANDSGVDSIVQALKSWNGVDILVNNAGIMRQGEKAEDFMESFRVNSVAPFLLTKALLPLLKKGRAPRVVNITSLMGSVADNKSGGYYAYRSSKSALNMINKSLTQDHEWLTAIVVHPGWVKTDMGGAQAPTEPEESAQGIWSVISGTTSAQSGKFFDFRGQELPW